MFEQAMRDLFVLYALKLHDAYRATQRARARQNAWQQGCGFRQLVSGAHEIQKNCFGKGGCCLAAAASARQRVCFPPVRPQSFAIELRS